MFRSSPGHLLNISCMFNLHRCPGGWNPTFKISIVQKQRFFYSNKGFRENVISELLKVVIENNDTVFKFFGIFRETLNIHAPIDSLTKTKKDCQGNLNP